MLLIGLGILALVVFTAQSVRIRLLRRRLEKEVLSRRILEYELEGARSLEQRTKELLESTRSQLADTFEAISHNTFSQSQRTFFDMARETFERYHTLVNGSVARKQEEIAGVLSPLKNSLESMEKKVHELEVSRKGAYEGMHQQLKSLSDTHVLLQKETGVLAKALREPNVRGRWGEIQLRRVVEMAGMLSYCDFEEQVCVSSDEGGIRPDMVVHLPNERRVVIDSKVSLSAYLEAVQTDDEKERAEKLAQHAKHIRQHVMKLAQKRYWEQFSRSPDFVVLFLHGDCFLAPALEYDRELLEFASAQKVLIATPTSLIAMLKVIAYSWGEAKVEQHAQGVLDEARSWLDRCRIFTEHFSDIGRHLGRTVHAYDKAVSSFENRLLVSVRRLAASGFEGAEIEKPSALRLMPTSMQHEKENIAGK